MQAEARGSGNGFRKGLPLLELVPPPCGYVKVPQFTFTNEGRAETESERQIRNQPSAGA